MNFPIDYLYRLVDRGGAGLSCDAQGVALGSAELARLHLEEGCVRRCEVRSPEGLGQILKTAYGPQPDAVVQRLHRGLRRTAAWLESGDLCQAGVEAVMLRVPDLNSTGVAKLAELADLEKRGASWEDQPRLPAGQTGGGQWTTDGGVSGSASASEPPPLSPPSSVLAPVPSTSPPERANPEPKLDFGLYHPGQDDPHFTLIGGPQEEEDEEPSYRSNGPPEEIATLQEMFPGLKEHPLATAVMAPLDHFIGFSAVADAMNLATTENIYRSLVSQIKAIDPHFIDYELFPAGGIAGLSWEGRANLVNDLLMKRASALYKIRHDPSQLQVETLKFLRKAVDAAYAEGVEKFRAGRLKVRLSDNEAIGNFVDRDVRTQLRELYNEYSISYEKGQNVIINNRDPNTLSDPSSYRIPDARIGNVSFDRTIGVKTEKTPQVRDFFDADSKPIGVVIVMPTQVNKDGAFYIPRPSTARKYSYVAPI